jgi:hypothetical protein
MLNVARNERGLEVVETVGVIFISLVLLLAVAVVFRAQGGTLAQAALDQLAAFAAAVGLGGLPIPALPVGRPAVDLLPITASLTTALPAIVAAQALPLALTSAIATAVGVTGLALLPARDAAESGAQTLGSRLSFTSTLQAPTVPTPTQQLASSSAVRQAQREQTGASTATEQQTVGAQTGTGALQQQSDTSAPLAALQSNSAAQTADPAAAALQKLAAAEQQRTTAQQSGDPAAIAAAEAAYAQAQAEAAPFLANLPADSASAQELGDQLGAGLATTLQQTAADLPNAQARVQQAAADVQALQTEIAETNQTIHDLNKEIRKTERELDKLRETPRGERSNVEQEEIEFKIAYLRYLRAQLGYAEANLPYLQALLARGVAELALAEAEVNAALTAQALLADPTSVASAQAWANAQTAVAQAQTNVAQAAQAVLATLPAVEHAAARLRDKTIDLETADSQYVRARYRALRDWDEATGILLRRLERWKTRALELNRREKQLARATATSQFENLDVQREYANFTQAQATQTQAAANYWQQVAQTLTLSRTPGVTVGQLQGAIDALNQASSSVENANITLLAAAGTLTTESQQAQQANAEVERLQAQVSRLQRVVQKLWNKGVQPELNYINDGIKRKQLAPYWDAGAADALIEPTRSQNPRKQELPSFLIRLEHIAEDLRSIIDRVRAWLDANAKPGDVNPNDDVTTPVERAYAILAQAEEAVREIEGLVGDIKRLSKVWLIDWGEIEEEIQRGLLVGEGLKNLLGEMLDPTTVTDDNGRSRQSIALLADPERFAEGISSRMGSINALKLAAQRKLGLEPPKKKGKNCNFLKIIVAPFKFVFNAVKGVVIGIINTLKDPLSLLQLAATIVLPPLGAAIGVIRGVVEKDWLGAALSLTGVFAPWKVTPVSEWGKRALEVTGIGKLVNLGKAITRDVGGLITGIVDAFVGNVTGTFKNIGQIGTNVLQGLTGVSDLVGMVVNGVKRPIGVLENALWGSAHKVATRPPPVTPRLDNEDTALRVEVGELSGILPELETLVGYPQYLAGIGGSTLARGLNPFFRRINPFPRIPGMESSIQIETTFGGAFIPVDIDPQRRIAYWGVRGGIGLSSPPGSDPQPYFIVTVPVNTRGHAGVFGSISAGTSFRADGTTPYNIFNRGVTTFTGAMTIRGGLGDITFPNGATAPPWFSSGGSITAGNSLSFRSPGNTESVWWVQPAGGPSFEIGSGDVRLGLSYGIRIYNNLPMFDPGLLSRENFSRIFTDPHYLPHRGDQRPKGSGQNVYTYQSVDFALAYSPSTWNTWQSTPIGGAGSFGADASGGTGGYIQWTFPIEGSNAWNALPVRITNAMSAATDRMRQGVPYEEVVPDLVSAYDMVARNPAEYNQLVNAIQSNLPDGMTLGPEQPAPRVYHNPTDVLSLNFMEVDQNGQSTGRIAGVARPVQLEVLPGGNAQVIYNYMPNPGTNPTVQSVSGSLASENFNMMFHGYEREFNLLEQPAMITPMPDGSFNIRADIYGSPIRIDPAWVQQQQQIYDTWSQQEQPQPWRLPEFQLPDLRDFPWWIIPIPGRDPLNVPATIPPGR